MVVVGLTAMFLAAVPRSHFSRGPGAEFHKRGFHDGIVSQNIDYEAIRAWGVAQQGAPSSIIPKAQWSNEIIALRPQMVTVDSDGTTSIIYGGGFGHWGIRVLPVANVPANRPTVAPGVYVWESE